MDNFLLLRNFYMHVHVHVQCKLVLQRVRPVSEPDEPESQTGSEYEQTTTLGLADTTQGEGPEPGVTMELDVVTMETGVTLATGERQREDAPQVVEEMQRRDDGEINGVFF